jgi:prepilin-type N-terminal cleavage/methylation domain-containing protein
MRKNSGSRGFSLVEVLVVIVVLAIVVVTLINVFVYGFNLVRKSEEVALATHVAQLEVETYRDMPFAGPSPPNISSLTPSTTTKQFTQSEYPFLFRPDGSPFLQNGQMTTAFNSGPVVAAGEPRIIKLTVIVTWEFRNRAMRKDVVTYISEDGLYR